ncbi:MAG TPA: hypothetical protein DDZ39_04725 [Flavobacteriaceae bacterium]|jgi:fatty acid desaturase|nr:hypothetical protein [Flavobacteriaceae bacterium]
MIIIASFIMFCGFYALYNTSKRAKLNDYIFDKWIQSHQKKSKPIGLLLLISAFIILIQYYGIAVGIFSGFIILMTISGLVIILTPLLCKKK